MSTVTRASTVSYSAFYGGCLIRESSDNQSVVKRARAAPMSVSAGEKCKLWEGEMRLMGDPCNTLKV